MFPACSKLPLDLYKSKMNSVMDYRTSLRYKPRAVRFVAMFFVFYPENCFELLYPRW
jgi:hypothetical protein